MDIQGNRPRDFLHSLGEATSFMLKLGFIQYYTDLSKPLYLVQFKRESTIVEFLFGPPEFHIDLNIITRERRFEFKDLVANSEIKSWIIANRPVSPDNVSTEMRWMLELIKVALNAI